jgi:hypothetical protein
MIYFLQDSRTFEIKIGYTGAADARMRLGTLQTGNPAGLVLLLLMDGERAQETALHHRFARAHVRGEWFQPVPELLQAILHNALLQARRDLPDTHSPSWLVRDGLNDAWNMRCPGCQEVHNHVVTLKPRHAVLPAPTVSLFVRSECGTLGQLCFREHAGILSLHYQTESRDCPLRPFPLTARG